MDKKRIWKSYRFPIILVMGIIVGALLGVTLGEKATVLKPLGDIFLNLMFTIVVPMVKPTIVSVALFQFMWAFNDFQGPLIYIDSVKKYPTSLGLRLLTDAETGFEWNKVLALSVITLLPSLIVFFLAQDQFVDGIAAGGVKG